MANLVCLHLLNGSVGLSINEGKLFTVLFTQVMIVKFVSVLFCFYMNVLLSNFQNFNPLVIRTFGNRISHLMLSFYKLFQNTYTVFFLPLTSVLYYL